MYADFWSWEMCEAWGTWAGAILTVLLLAVGLYEVGLLDGWLGPRLELIWDGRPPLVQAIESWGSAKPPQMPFQVRLRVVNSGYRPAKDVSVFLKSVRATSDSSIDYRLADFIPARLQWTHLNAPQRDFIAPGSFALCDFAAMQPCGNDDQEFDKLLDKIIQADKPVSFYRTTLCLEAIPTNGGAQFGGGTFQFQFEIFDRSGVCGAGELRMMIGTSFIRRIDELPPIEITIAHHANRRFRRI